MLGRYANSSEASSTSPVPALNSRASSSTAVLSPLEDFRTSRYIKPDVLPEERPGEEDIVFKSPTDDLSRSGKILQGSAYSFDPEPNGPYFSIPRKQVDNVVPLRRRGTTKELISRYESLSVDEPSSKGTDLSKQGSRYSSSATNTVTTQKAEERKGKGRSPIRQSLRNLLSVFNKKGKAAREPSLYVADLLSPPEEHLLQAQGEDERPLPPPPPVPTKSPMSSLPPINTDPVSLRPSREEFEEPTCITPLPLHTGTLLYLCKPVTPDSLPVWISCNASLHRTHVVLTWFSALGNPSTSLVQLSQCTDVRSLALCDLESAEASMLPEDPEFIEPKVFELLFEGKAREKFAAASVKGRAGWVSAVWDAVLHTSAQRTPFARVPSAGPHSSVPIFDTTPTVMQTSVAGSNRASPSTQVEDTNARMPSEMTPPPRSADPVKIQLFDPPVSKATPPPLTPDKSTYSRLPTPGRQSPSVRHLDQMSIVQQRLAQLERATSLNTPSPSPAKSTRSRQIISPPVSPVDMPRQSILLRHGTISSIGQDSLVDSHPGNNIHFPLSPESGRLPSIPSGKSLAIEHSSFIARISRMNAPQVPEKPDVFSPASQYSEIAKPSSPSPALSMKTDGPGGRSTPTTPTRLLAAFREHAYLPEKMTSPLHLQSRPSPAPSPVVESAVTIPPATLSDLSSQSVTKAPSQPLPQVTVLPDPEQHLRLSRIRGQISEIREEMHKLPEALGAVVAELPHTVLPTPPPKDDEGEKILLGIDEGVKRIEEQSEVHAQGLAGIHAKVDAIMALRQADVSSPLPSIPPELVDGITAKLEEISSQLNSDLPGLSQKLEALVAQRSEQAASDAPQVDPVSVPPGPPVVAAEEFSRLYDKLEEILNVVHVQQPGRSESDPNPDHQPPPTPETAETAVTNTLEELLALAKSEKEQRETHAAAQADSARYLNELNSWLETFVKHGTSQIETVAAGVQNLCKELGPVEAVGEDGQPVPHDGHNGGLLSEVKQLLVGNKGSDEKLVTLQASVDGLMTALHESIQAVEARNRFPTDTVVAIIERQRQDQEHMLKTLATELSNDIRGERLRFVEAMKEATTINVQIHVEEFKKELTREVFSMTQEVTRLQRERQALEQQIADLFAFYAKQKQANEMKQGGKKKGRAPPEPGPQPGGSGRRPLPSPGPVSGQMPGVM